MDPCQGHSHDHDHEDAQGVSLRKYYDLDGVLCYNENVAGSGRQMIAKYYEQRFDIVPYVTSPVGDAELLVTIPFTEAVTIQYLSITGRNPRRIKLFVNRIDMDFDTAREMPADMALELVPNDHIPVVVVVVDNNNNNNNGTVDYPLRPAGRFRNIDVLTIFFVDNYDVIPALDDNDDDDDDDVVVTPPTEVSYVGLKGTGSGIQRQCVEAVYETRGMLKDHKVKDDAMGSSNLLL